MNSMLSARLQRRFVNLTRPAKTFIHFDRPTHYVLDIGSSSIRVAADQKIVFAEPSCIALHQKTKAVVAYGKHALELFGKAPPSVEVIFPVRHAKIVDEAAFQLLFQSIWREVLGTELTFLPLAQLHLTIATAKNLSVIYTDFLQQLFRSQGFVSVRFVKKSAARLHRLRQQGAVSAVVCGIDFGAMTTEMGIFAQQEEVASASLPFGSEDLTQEVLRVVRREQHCDIGWQTAEKVKQTVGRIGVEKAKPKVFTIRGRDMVMSLPQTAQVSSQQFDAVFTDRCEEIFAALRQLYEDAPPDIVTAALEQGIYLTGGGSLLSGFAQKIAATIQTHAYLSETPFVDTILGLPPAG